MSRVTRGGMALLEPARLARVMDNERRLAPDADRFTLPELFERLERAAFAGSGSPSQDRRSLQRLFVQHLAELVLNPPGGTPAEASISSALKPCPSAQRRYMRNSISAQSCASVPPAPD